MILEFIAFLLFPLVLSGFCPERLQQEIRQRFQQFLLSYLVQRWAWLSVKGQSELAACRLW